MTESTESTAFDPQQLFQLFGIGQTESALKRKFNVGNLLMMTDGYYVPPIDFTDYALLKRAHPYHQLALEFETEKMLEFFAPASLTPYAEFAKIASDYFCSGNAFYLKNRNVFGEVRATNNGMPAISHLPFVYMREMVDGNYCQLNNYQQIVKIYPRENVGHIKKYDELQSVYGIAPWLAQLQAILFGEDTILTPRRELTAGITRKIIGLLGFSGEQVKGIVDQLKESKGHQELTAVIGMPDKDGKKLDDLMKIYPDDSTFKVDFDKFFRLSAETIIECHQIPWFLIGAQPDNGSSAPDLDKVERIYTRKILIMMKIFEAMNDDVNGAIIFSKPTI